MFKSFLYFTFGFLLMGFNLVAENNDQLLNAIYLVPEDACEFVTGGKTHYLSDGKFSINQRAGFVDISFYDGNEHFSCYFGAGKNQELIPGIYENAERMPFSPEIPELDFGGFGRGYNRLIGEFEIFEIQYAENGNISSFAADFTIFGKAKKSILRGAVRFNSNYPVDEYFIKMTDPSINFDSQQLFYVRETNAKTQELLDVIVIDKKNLSISLNEFDNGFNLIVEESGNCGFKNRINFYIPSLSDLSNLEYFAIEPRESEFSDDDDWDFFDQKNRKTQPRIIIDPKNGRKVYAENGHFAISELVFDIKNKKILSLAVDFHIQDEKSNVYEGVVRYNSTIPLLFE